MRSAPQQPTTTATATPDDIDLRDVFRTLGKKLPKLALSSLLVGGATAGLLTTMLPRYTSVAQLEVQATGAVDPTKPNDDRGGGRDVTARMDAAAISTHAAAMQSNDIARKLVEEFKLIDNPEFNAALPPKDSFSSVLRMVGIGAPKATETDADRALTALRSNLRIFNARETRQISVQMSSSSPKLSADVANRVGVIYRERLASATIVETNDAAERLKPQVVRLTRDVAEAEQEATTFRGKVDSFRGNQQNGGLSEQQLSELTVEQVKAQTAKTEAEGKASAARELMSRGSAEALPDVQKSALIPRLVEQRVRQERQISELSATLLPAHPRMKQLQADLSGLNKQIKGELQKIVDGIERDARLASDREAAVRQRIATVKQTVTQKGPDEAHLRSLEDSAKAKREELSRVQKQYEAAVSTTKTGAVPVDLRFISQAAPSSEKSFPKTSMIAPLASAATFVLGLFFVGIGALFRGARGGGAPAAPAAVAVEEPVAPAPRALAAQTIAVRDPMPAARGDYAVGSVGAVAQSLLTRTPGQVGCRTLVTGAAPSCDPASEALDVAKALAASGRPTLLIEWATGSGGLAQHLGVDAGEGISELINGALAFDDVVHGIDGSDVHVVTAGLAPRASAEIDADRANLILDALDERYEHIIVVAPEAAAKALFSGIQGRFDVGVTVEDGKARTAPLSARQNGAFLGFSVDGLETMVIRRRAPADRGPRMDAGMRRGSTLGTSGPAHA